MENADTSVPEPISQPQEGRNIVLCFDGTGDWATVDTTNVMKIYGRTDKSAQLVYYSGGIGTLGSPLAISPFRRLFLKLLDLAVATSLREHVLNGYTFLVKNHRPGDRIYLFGFSRGAFTARVLASLIHSFGLLEARNENLVPYVWQTVSEFNSIGEFKRDSAKIKKDFARHDPDPVTVGFMGLFDTVSSVGVFDRFKVYPYTDKNPSVEVVRHAVSVDEQRNTFPELLLIPARNDVGEVWFPGVHRDIGGGGADNLGYPNLTLSWIVDEAHKHGLKLDISAEPASGDKVHLPLFDPYVFVGLYPMKMFDYSLVKLAKPNWSYSRIVDLLLKRPKSGDSGFRWFWPNFNHVRRCPRNGFTYVGDGKVKHDGSIQELSSVRCAGRPEYEPYRFSFPDLVGIVLGVALSVLIANRGMDEPLGRSWPGHSSTLAFWLFVLYLVHQGFRQCLGAQTQWKWLNAVMPALGTIATILLAVATWEAEPWWMLVLAFCVGAIVAIVSLFGRQPILRANRVIPLFIVPWFMIIVSLWVIPPLAEFIFPAFASGVHWLTGMSLAFDLFPALDYIAWTIAIFAGLFALSQIVQDRRKMENK